MATVLRILVFLALASVGLQILFYGSRISGDPLGKPPIAWPALLLAKVSLIVSLALLLLRAVQGDVLLSPATAAVFVCLLIGGAAIFTAAFPRLGKNLRMGLPKEQTVLVTSGVYCVSRNPIYLALFCLLGASLVYAFSWVNLAAAGISVVLHHRIVLAEEKYLAGRFAEYEGYRRRVRRYL